MRKASSPKPSAWPKPSISILLTPWWRRLLAPKPATYIGSGKVAEIAKRVADAEAELVVVNAQLSPIQQRNLETDGKPRCWTAPGSSWKSSAAGPARKEGILQVELAHLQLPEKPACALMDPLGTPARRLRLHRRPRRKPA